MFTKKGVDVIQVTSENYFDDQYEFTASKGFQVAFAFISSPLNSELYQLDPSYGEFKFQRTEYGLQEDGTPYFNVTPIPSHRCSAEELGVNGSSKAKFMPIKENYRQLFEAVYQNFVCIVDEDLRVSGNVNSAYASYISVELAKCNKEVNDFCKTDKEIDEFFFGSLLHFLSNQIRFDQNLYGEESIV